MGNLCLLALKENPLEKEEKLSISPLFLGYGLKGQLVHVIETVQHGPQSNNKNSSLFFFPYLTGEQKNKLILLLSFYFCIYVLPILYAKN